MRNLYYCHLVLIVIFELSQACLDRWFGKTCSFLCHCEWQAVCNKTSGQCPRRCDRRWFGPACQYKSVFYWGPNWLTDWDDRTCNHQAHPQVNISLTRMVYLTWIRVVLRDADRENRLTIKYKMADSQSYRKAVFKRARFSTTTIDFYGINYPPTKELSLSGGAVNQLCSVYISQGRNLALKQNDHVSQMHAVWDADNAVDGDTGEDWSSSEELSRVCAKAEHGRRQSIWVFNLRHNAHLDQLEIYFKQTSATSDYNPEKKFSVSFFTKKTKNVIWETYHLDEYTAQVPLLERTVDSIRLVMKAKHFHFALCEVKVFGDYICEGGTFGFQCERPCNCRNTKEACQVPTGGCSSGCRAGYGGGDCWSECGDRTWGHSCSQWCSTSCKDELCDPVDGACYACTPGKVWPSCEKDCARGTWGNGCYATCSTKCKNQLCDPVDGMCYECNPGKVWPACEIECPPGTWGAKCSQTCPSKCKDQLCDPVDGVCYECNPGKVWPACEKACGNETSSILCPEMCMVYCANETIPCKEVGRSICEDGCVPGYLPPHCRDECPGGTWGHGCTEMCSSRCRDNLCDPVGGLCYECNPGKKWPACEKACDKTSSIPCPEMCMVHCASTETVACKEVGRLVCEDGCDPGYQPPLCREVCQTRMFGQNCTSQCSDQCAGGVENCNPINGHCDRGCLLGYRPPLCLIGHDISPLDVMEGDFLGFVASMKFILGPFFAGILLVLVGTIGCRVWLSNGTDEGEQNINRTSSAWETTSSLRFLQELSSRNRESSLEEEFSDDVIGAKETASNQTLHKGEEFENQTFVTPISSPGSEDD